MADLVYTGRFDLNPARNTREKLLLPLSDIESRCNRRGRICGGNEDPEAGHYNW